MLPRAPPPPTEPAEPAAAVVDGVAVDVGDTHDDGEWLVVGEEVKEEAAMEDLD